MAWVSPTGHNDPNSKWNNEEAAYDDDTGTQAWTFYAGYYLELLLESPISCDKVRSYWGYASPPNVNIDVYYSGAWHNIHSGEIAKDEWVETEIGSTQTVEKARVKINTGVTHWLREFDFNETGGQTHYGSATLAGTGALAAAARATYAGKATLAGTGALAAAGQWIRSASATLSGTGALSAAAVLTIVAAATLSGEGTLAAAGTVIPAALYGSATLSGTGTLAAVAWSFPMSPTLLAAQQALHRIPYVEAKVYDYERGIKRLAWTRLYTGSEPDNHQGIAFDGEGSMHRIRADTGDKLYHQKITNPGPTSDYSSWTEIASDCAGPCAIAACGSKIYVFYKKTDDTIRKYYSHNYCSSWTNAQLSTYAGLLSMAAAWWGTGDNVVCFALKATQINGIVLDTSDQTTDENTRSDTGHPWLNTYGLGATYNPYWPGMELVIAARQSDTPYNHYDLFRTKFSDLYNFLSLESFLTAPQGEDITYEYPDCHLPAGAQDYEITRVVAVEKYTGVTAYTRPIISHLVKGTHWSDTTFVEPRPFMDIAPAYGLRMQSTSSHWWISTPSGVCQAARPAGDPLDLSPRIIHLSLRAAGVATSEPALTITLDNSDGAYNVGAGLVPALINKRHELVLKLGYRTSAGAESKDAGTYWIDSWQYSHAPNQSLFTIHCLDGWGLMERWTARYQMRWNKDEIGPKTVWQIMYQVLARVGIRLTNTPPKPKSSAIDNLYPDFTIDPGTQGTQALSRLLSFVPDRLVFRGQEAFTKDILASEAPCYPYGPDHPIIQGEYTEQVTPSRSRALGRETDGDRVLEDSLDWDLLDLAIDILDQDYDPNLQTATRAQERADAILRNASLRAKRGNLLVPTNVVQQLLDVVQVTDQGCGIDQENYRVMAIRTDHDRRNPRYTQRLTLAAP